jgi:hypothetical protein
MTSIADGAVIIQSSSESVPSVKDGVYSGDSVGLDISEIQRLVEATKLPFSEDKPPISLTNTRAPAGPDRIAIGERERGHRAAHTGPRQRMGRTGVISKWAVR